eukprot:CAMPEP_0113878610 /NCGR_PEP_ID=MMETSP0780_2-20120614/6785_1 /TAXON_ID=652834 /ORGANISM="Palpitomonas bilix" /LENGTH=539 /DNA_ID=CAMNT_0000865113 /DNA_START=102 /DNA_END=1719 /DNA_ORIENTATION=- /assembly_acc=CAM_ASM_000599
MPEQGIDLTQNADLLQTDELLKLAKVFTSLGVDKVRLTGGEPLVRKDFLDVFEGLSSDEKITSLGLTTNGITLSRHLPKMVDMAGLDRLRINISLDTLSDKKYAFISRRNGYDKVMRSIDDCISAGLSSLKVNVVVMRNVNEDEVLDFVEFTKDRDIEVRFIEYMPFDDNKWSAKKMVSYAEMLDMIKRKYPLQRAVGDVNDTSKVYHVPGHAGRVGFITSMSDHFCGGCNRIRLLADGNLKVCLFGANEISLRDALRWGLPEEDISALVHGALLKKKFKHAGMFDLSQMKNRPMKKLAVDRSPHLGLLGGGERARHLRMQGRTTARWRAGVHAVPAFVEERLQSGTLYRSPAAAPSVRFVHGSAAPPPPPPREGKSGVALSHFGEDGRVGMVDVSSKGETKRVATAEGWLRLPKEVVECIEGSRMKKFSTVSELEAICKIAGIQAAKKTSDLVPMCHPLLLSQVDVRVTYRGSEGLYVLAKVVVSGKTGVEMEALTAVSVSLLTGYDMLKAAGKGMEIEGVRLLKKEGGKGGTYVSSS